MNGFGPSSGRGPTAVGEPTGLVPWVWGKNYLSTINLMPDFTSTPLNPNLITPPIMPMMQQHVSRHVFKWLIGLAVVLGVVSVLLFYFGGAFFTESGVLLTITGPTQASVGDEVIYKV